MEVTSIKRTTAADETFRTLHDMIISGQLKPGNKLPPQDKLAQQLGVSRNTVREAINKLTVMGLLTAKHGIGTLINITSPAAYMASLTDHLLLQPGTVSDFLEARIIVEMATVRLAVLRADDPIIAELETNLRKQKDAVKKGDTDAFVPLDVQFHLTLAVASGNKVLQQFLGTLTDLLGKFIREVVPLPQAMHNALSYHRELLNLIRARDAEAAERKLIEHLQDVMRNIERSTGMEIGANFPFSIEKADSGYKRRRKPKTDSVLKTESV